MLVQFSELEETQNKLIKAEKTIFLLRLELAEARNIVQCIVRDVSTAKTVGEPLKSNSLTVGDYSIAQCSDGNYWISHVSGAGMQTTSHELFKYIDKFWKENFPAIPLYYE